MKTKLKYFLLGLSFVFLFSAGSVYAINLIGGVRVNGGGTGQVNIPDNYMLTGSSTNQSLNLTAPGASSTVWTMIGGVPGWFPAQGASGGGLGTVTSVDMTVPTGLSISGNPIITAGTLAVSLQAGYNIPLTASTTNWNGFYNTPSTRITAGTNLSWSGNTLNASGGGGSASSSGVSGSVQFAGVGGILSSDASNFFWDDTNNRLGIGTNSPQSIVHIQAPFNPTILLTDNSSSPGFGTTTNDLYIANFKGSLDFGYRNSTSSATSTFFSISPRGSNVTIDGSEFITGMNIAIGVEAAPIFSQYGLNFPTLGGPNVMIGYQAGKSIAYPTEGENSGSAYYNIGIGGQALKACTSCSENIAIGNGALFSLLNSTSTGTTVGESFGFAQGKANAVFGIEAGLLLGSDVTASSSHNTLLGNYTFGGTEGSRNTIVGSFACIRCSGDLNVVIGQAALGGTQVAIAPMSQNRNVLIGALAYGLGAASAIATSSNDNIAIGYAVLPAAISTRQNTVIGFKAGPELTYGNNNILLGYKAGSSITTGSNNIVIGHNIGMSNPSNALSLGNLLFGTNLTAFINTSTDISAGRIGIGTTTPIAKLSILASSTDATIPIFVLASSSGTTVLQVSGNGTVKTGSPITNNTGCIEIYDSVNTTTLEYIYTVNSVLTATTTKPSFCN